MAPRVAVLDEVRVVNAGQAVQWNTNFEIVPVADIEETLHASAALLPAYENR